MRPFFPRSRPKKKIPLPLLCLLFLLLFCAFHARTYRIIDYFRLPFSPRFAKEYVLLEPGERYSLKINGILRIASFRSQHPIIASVTQTGVVHSWKCGRSIITATIHNKNGKKIHCIVRVTQLNFDSVTLSVGQTKRLRIKGIYFGTSYQSSDPDIATVTRFGKIRAIRPGKAVITASAKGKTFRCTVTIPAINAK